MEEQNNKDFEQPKPKKPFPTKIVAIVSSLAVAAGIGVTALVMSIGDNNEPPSHTCSFGDWATTKEATCGLEGERTRVCECGEKETQPIDKLAHAFGEWLITKKASCKDEGEKTRVCATCNFEDKATISKTEEHIEVIDNAVSATCAEVGKTVGRHCSLCNKILVEQKTTPKLAHTYDDKYDEFCNVCNFEREAECAHLETITLEGYIATCLTNGLTEGSKCKKCEEILVAQSTITAPGHTLGNWVTDSEATCTVNGSKHQVCSVCNATLGTETIIAPGHTPGDWVTDSEATCTVNGSKHQVCFVCNATLGTETIIAPGHTPGDWVTDTEATCTVNGSKHQVCSVCNATFETETIIAPGHTPGDWITDIEATCTDAGTKHRVCLVCDDIIETETIAASHNLDRTIIKATSSSNAKIVYRCTNCDYSREDVLSSISVYARLTGTGTTVTNGGYYHMRSFEVTAYGGYGQYKYKFEAGSNLLRDFSSSNEIEVYGNSFIDLATITITVMDDAGQQTVYKIKGDGTYVDSYVIYD